MFLFKNLIHIGLIQVGFPAGRLGFIQSSKQTHRDIPLIASTLRYSSYLSSLYYKPNLKKDPNHQSQTLHGTDTKLIPSFSLSFSLSLFLSFSAPYLPKIITSPYSLHPSRRKKCRIRPVSALGS